MAYEMRDGEGSLFRNDRAGKDTDPTHKGQAKIDGRDYWVNAWVNETEDGQKYFKLKFNPKD